MAERETGVARREGQRQPARATHPLFGLRDEIDTLFDRFFSGSLLGPFAGLEAQPLRQSFGGVLPKVDVSESDSEIQIVAELPGLKQDEVELSLEEGVLTLRGETRASREERDKQYHLSERSYGRFERSFRLPETIDRERISANFDNGLLTVTLPKSAKAERSARRIAIGRK